MDRWLEHLRHDDLALLERATGRRRPGGGHLRPGMARPPEGSRGLRRSRPAGLPGRPGAAAVPDRAARLLRPRRQRQRLGPDRPRLAAAPPQRARPGPPGRRAGGCGRGRAARCLAAAGDLALFLTGIFPDHTDARGFGPVQASRLLRSAGLGPGDTEAGGGVVLLELLGRRWYPGPAGRQHLPAWA
jgi:hypothetical protein